MGRSERGDDGGESASGWSVEHRGAEHRLTDRRESEVIGSWANKADLFAFAQDAPQVRVRASSLGYVAVTTESQQDSMSALASRCPPLRR